MSNSVTANLTISPIEYGRPLPKVKRNPRQYDQHRKYPWEQMKPGGSFLVQTNEPEPTRQQLMRCRAAVFSSFRDWRLKDPAMRADLFIKTRAEGNGIRVALMGEEGI